MQNLFRHLHVEPELAVELLALFSRMEYALKVSDFAVGDDKTVAPNWDAFANAVNDDFLAIADEAVVEARELLLQSPPRKQVLLDGHVRFADQVINTKQRRTQQLLLMVRTVRNNLFHGGKYLPNGEQEPGRDERFVRASITVLRACSVLHHLVRVNFEH
ncbi:hypothetical protein SNE35_09650 [Paucibacter sp. R3-3]|uniref:Apea-like HEPN domain-containing protein n=1 Tax=Roseateles agri TaxID=3098619 RepID=A0ABU5DES2_9BURK|nr:hypothetical protein [Paucibacter sp. R3-3]MDY0744773.1 hypothetical protein [Paucibacter sp. R3-3]